MQEGSFRCDANISLRPRGEDKLGTRTELKNMNSFRNVQLALEYGRRQRDLLLDGGEVVQQTCSGIRTGAAPSPCAARRSPRLPLLPGPGPGAGGHRHEAWIERVQAGLPSCPTPAGSGSPPSSTWPRTAELLTGSRELADYFEAALGTYANAHRARQFHRYRTAAATDRSASTARVPGAAGPARRAADDRGRPHLRQDRQDRVRRDARHRRPKKQIVKEQGLVQMSDEGRAGRPGRGSRRHYNPAQAQRSRRARPRCSASSSAS